MDIAATPPPQLTERQEKILALVVREYINKPEPVGSKYLADNFLTNISSATIRNDLAALEELGYVTAPHTSAGRVPTEAGYRYVVKRLPEEGELPADEQKSIASEFSQAPNEIEQWMQFSAATLARTSRGAALVTAPYAHSSQFKHIELISTQGRLVLMVLVMYGGEVRQQMLTLADTLSQEALTAAATRINQIVDGLTGEQVQAKLPTVDNELEHEILEIVAETLGGRDNQHVIAYRDGLSGVLAEFTESEGAQQALRMMEERSPLAGILSEALSNDIGQVQVVIAGDGRWTEARHLSMVLTRYGVNGQATGTLTVLGPTRMRYGRAISAVRYVAGLMSNLLFDVYGSEAPPPNENDLPR